MTSRQTGSISLSSGASLGNHSTVSQCARAARATNDFAGVDRTRPRPARPAWPFARVAVPRTVALLQMGDEIAAALGRAGMHDELARDVIERPQHRDFWPAPATGTASPPPTSPRRGRDQDASAPRSHHRRKQCRPLRPAACAVAGAGPPVHLAFRLDVPSACAGPPASGTFFSRGLDSSERLMRTPSRASISARRRIVQLRRSATGSSSNGVITRKAASLFTGGGPGAMLVFSAVTPPAVKSLRHRRTASSAHAKRLRDLRAGPTRQSARRAPGPPRRGSRELAIANRPARCSSLAVTGDFSAIIHLANAQQAANRKKPTRWLPTKYIGTNSATGRSHRWRALREEAK